MSSLLVLALATSALAAPFGGDNAHHKHRYGNHVLPSGVLGHTGTGAPFPVANATGWYGATAGTAANTAFPVSYNTAPASEALPESTSCSRSTAYVTEVSQVTMTIHQSSSAEAVPASYKGSAIPFVSLSYEGKQRLHRSSYVQSFAAASTVDAPSTSTSVYVAPSTTSVDVAPTVTSVDVASSSASVASSAISSSASSASSASSTASSSSSSSSGKRGVAYNDALLTTAFEGSSEVSWGYNWGQSSSGLSSKFNYVPLLWGTSSTFTDGWAATVSAAASNGVTHLMSFNEPDMSTQANMSPEDAATAYKKYMQPYAGKFKLGAPAVTNGGGAMGLNWLSDFLSACDGCTIDFVSAHWYDSPSNTEYFKEHVANVSAVAGGKPVWLTEFGVTSGSDSDICTFLEDVMPWMDSQDYIERYAYFMVADGKLLSGGSMSTYGSTYSSYTSSS